jgi:N-acetylglutamate synthase-like GNAT family acetyltransferase
MIRPFEKTDKPHLLKLLNKNIPRYFDPAELVDFESYFDKGIEDYYVVEIDGKPIACGGINYNTKDKICVLSWDIVHPKYQGKGYGKQLVEYRLNHINKLKDINAIMVRTSQLTHEFYAKAGFKLEKVVPDYWAEGFDLYQMKINLQ